MASILLIDDEVLVRETLRLTLTEAGHSVAIAVNGAEGLRKMNALPPDLVITDIVMPDQEGIETIIAIRKANLTVPIIAISGNVDFLKAATVFGATKILRKPFGNADLLKMVNECLTAHPA